MNEEGTTRLKKLFDAGKKIDLNVGLSAGLKGTVAMTGTLTLFSERTDATGKIDVRVDQKINATVDLPEGTSDIVMKLQDKLIDRLCSLLGY